MNTENSVNLIRVGLLDDHQLFREGIKSLIDKIPEVELVLEAESGSEFFRKLEQVELDVLLLDLEMDEMDGIAITKQLVRTHPALKIIILTMHKEERMVSYLMELGAHAYLLKNASVEALKSAILNVFSNGYHFNNLVSKSLLNELKSGKGEVPVIGDQYGLTERELDVLRLIAKERTTAEIAEELFLSTRTIEGYRKNILQKLGVKNSAGLIVKAIRENIISI